MTAVCKVCGEIIRLSVIIGTGAVTVTPLLGSANPAETPETIRAAARDMIHFELLAHELAQHIGRRHPKEAAQLNEVSQIAARVYAMTHATTSAESDKFNQLRLAWYKALSQRLQTPEAAAAPSTPSGPSGSSSSSSSGTGL